MALLQTSYLLLGVMMNLMSAIHHRRTGRYFTPVPPRRGLLAMALYALVLPLQYASEPLFFQLATLGMTGLIAYGGIYVHLRTHLNAGYATPGCRRAALLINGYGVAISAVALACL